MFNKKLSLLFAISAFGFVVSSIISSKGSTFNNLSIKDEDFIILFKDGKNIVDFKNEISSFSKDIEITEKYNGVVNGVRVKANSLYKTTFENLNSVLEVGENNFHKINITETEPVYDSSTTL